VGLRAVRGKVCVGAELRGGDGKGARMDRGNLRPWTMTLYEASVISLM